MQHVETHPQHAVDVIRAAGYHATPQIGLITGSGLNKLADCINNKLVVSYADLPGFSQSSVQGHGSQLVLGDIAGVPVACLQGRVHVYEGMPFSAMKQMIRTLKLLGCHSVVLTNAAGSLRKKVKPGELMLITDHINMQPGNPLIGANDDEFGPRFFSMDTAYDLEHRNYLLHAAKHLKIRLAQGVYLATSGPGFETPAEIHGFRTMGADAVGMSTVPEVLIARHCGLRVAAISTITNFAAGMSNELLTHDGTLHFASIGVEKLLSLLVQFIGMHAT